MTPVIGEIEILEKGKVLKGTSKFHYADFLKKQKLLTVFEVHINEHKLFHNYNFL